MTLSYKIKQDQRAPTQVSRAKRPLHRAYSSLSILFALVMLAVVGVGIVGASPSTIQYGVGWFYDGAQTGSAVTPATSDSPMQPAAAPDEIGFERQLFLLINKLRVEKGLAPLVSNKALTNAARTHAKDMGKASQFSIVDANGTLPAQRVAAAGYAQAQSLHELISAGFSKPDQALAALTANSTTASILLGTDINEIGIGYNFASKIIICRHRERLLPQDIVRHSFRSHHKASGQLHTYLRLRKLPL